MLKHIGEQATAYRAGTRHAAIIKLWANTHTDVFNTHLAFWLFITIKKDATQQINIS